MPDVRKQVRTLALRQPRYFDDRAWPTNAALVALALFVAGIVVLESRFAQPRPSSNMMWLQLLAIGAALAASLWAARVTGRAFTQRIKLCVSLSLLFHVGLLLAMHHHHLKLFVERTEPAEMAIVETRFEKDVPQEMFIQPPEVGEEKRPIEQPLATGKPQLATDRLTPERTTPELLDSIRQSHELPEPQSQPEPQLVRARRPEQAIAMRSEQTGRRSRRESEAAQANASAVELEATAAASATRATAEPSPAAQAQRLARAEAVTPLSEPMTEPVDAASVREALVAPRRESPTEPSPETVAMVPRERQSERPARIQQQAIANNDAPSASQLERAAPLRSVTQELERTAAAPVFSPTAPEALPDELAMTTTRQLPRQLLTEQLPTVAHDEQSSSERRRADVAAAVHAEATTTRLAEQAATRSRQAANAQPTNVTLARAPDTSLTASAVNASAENEPASASEVVPRAQLSRVADSNVPSVQTNQADASKSREHLNVAELAAAGTEQIRDIPTAPTAQGNGGGTPTAAAPRADTTHSSLARAATATVTGQPTDVGAPETSAVGQLDDTQLPTRRRADALAGQQSGGGPPRPRRSRAPQAAGPVEAALPSLSVTADVGGGPTGTAGRSASAPQAGATADLPRSATARPTAIVADNGSFAPTDGQTPTAQQLAIGRPAPAARAPAVERPAGPVLSREPGRQPAALPSSAVANVEQSTAGSATPRTAMARRSVAPAAGLDSDSLGRSAARAPVLIDAIEGEGGLGPTASQPVGVPDRRASRDAQLAHVAPSRIIERHVGGGPSISGAARVPAAAFSQRGRRQEELITGGEGKPSAKTEAAIELGLEFLARLQLSDGRWGFQNLGGNADFAAGETPSLRADAAATGLALLSFLGAGYDHYDDKYQNVVRKGLDYLVRVQSDNGELFPENGQPASAVTRFYGHGIASLALCEAYGMTGDDNLREPAQRALDYIAATQHPNRGGWRYMPGVNSDLSVTGWQLMALRSGQLAGLDVRDDTFGRVRDMVEACREREGEQFRFCYNPWASASNPRTRHGRRPSTVMTAVGLLAQLYLGSNRENFMMQGGANHLLDNLPTAGTSQRLAPTGTLENPLRDTYYWYYATQVMFHMGGEHWQAWNDSLHPLLVDTQTPVGPLAGSWNPNRPVPDKWGRYGGRLYITTLNLLSLEVYYRHLPLYEMTAQ